jgi:hypothetical protein
MPAMQANPHAGATANARAPWPSAQPACRPQ